MPRVSKGKRSYAKFTRLEEHDEFLSRISKTLYYTKLPVTDCLSLPVTELAAEIFTEVKNGQTLERLDVKEASRISRNACVSPCSLVLALLYLERLKDCNPEYLQRVAPSELFLVSLMVASKFLHDDGEEDEVFNAEWAHSGHLSIAKMNHLEKDFLKAINWSVYVHNHDFWEKLQRLEKNIAYKEAQKRGWFSYTELNTLLDSIHLTALVNTFLSVASICIATYAAGLITLIGSAMVTSCLPGTSLSSEQNNLPTCLSSYEHTLPVDENSELGLEEQIESIVSNSISEEMDVCNKSYHQNILTKNNYSMEVNKYNQIIDSITSWVPNCSNWKLKYTGNNKNKFDETNKYATKTVFTIDIDRFSEYSNLVKNFNIKTFDSNLKMFPHDWKYYVRYFSKIALSHGQ